MGFVVTEEMVAEQFQNRGRIIYGDTKSRLELLQYFVDRHNLAPASAVEEVELTPEQGRNLYEACYWIDGDKKAFTIQNWLAENGLRIVRDAKPVMPFSRKTPPLNLPDDDGFCSVGGLAVDLGLYKSSDAKPVPADDAAKRDAKDATIAELMKRVDALELGYRDAKATNAEIQDDVDRLDAATGELLEWCKRLSREKAPAESRNPEPKAVAAERTFTEAEVRAAMRLLKSDVAIRHIFDKLGIDMEATK